MGSHSTQIALVRPGATDFDSQNRIRGTLDIPLNSKGENQAADIAQQLTKLDVSAVFCSPCKAAQQTADELARSARVKVKVLESLRNLDHGLWQGRSIEEMRQTQPRIYRLWQEHPDQVCPPGGETLESAEKRIAQAIEKVTRKKRKGVVVVVVSEPLASLVHRYLCHDALGDLWKAECECGGWELIDFCNNQGVLVENRH